MSISHPGTTTTVFADNGDGYFGARLDNGGIRIGLRNVQSFNIPADHALFDACAKATHGSIEAVFDKLFAVLQSPIKTHYNKQCW